MARYPPDVPENAEAETVLHYAPRTRAFTALWLLEELGIDYRLDAFNIYSGRQREPEFLAINPMGKVPAVTHAGQHVSELGAIAIYFADLFPDAGLAPAMDDLKRADYLRWCFFASAIMEPSLGEKFLKWEAPSGQMAWGSFDRMMAALLGGMDNGPYLLGEAFSAADILVGSSVRFGQMFGAFDKDGPLGDYTGRLKAREAFQRASAIEKRVGEEIPPPAKK